MAAAASSPRTRTHTLIWGHAARVDWWAILALPLGAPVAYLVWLAGQASLDDVLASLARSDVARLAYNATLVAAGAVAWGWAVGVPTAWLLARTDVPGRTVLRWLAPLPFAVPPYVGALVYAVLLAPGGLAHQTLARLRGAPVGLTPFPDLLYSPLGAGFVLGIFSAPYLFIAVYAALQRTSPSLEEAARSLGRSNRAVFFTVTLPLLRPSLLAGSLLIFLYGWVDFGAVSLLRVRTFTTAIYNALLAGFSLPSAAALSLVLVASVSALLMLQRAALGAARYTQADRRSQHHPRMSLGRWRWVAVPYLAVVLALPLAVPVLVLTWLAADLGGARLLAFVADQGIYLLHSLAIAVAAASLALGLGTLFAWRHWSGHGSTGPVLLQLGYAIPGTVLGLSLVGLTVQWLPALYGTPLVLVAACVILFAAPAVQAATAALAQVPPSLAEAARALGHAPLAALSQVVVPLALPGLLGGWLLVFALAMRELAATIVLRPAGFDTLAVRIWVHTMDVGPDPRAAAAALLLMAVTGAAWIALLLLQSRSQASAEALA